VKIFLRCMWSTCWFWGIHRYIYICFFWLLFVNNLVFPLLIFDFDFSTVYNGAFVKILLLLLLLLLLLNVDFKRRATLLPLDALRRQMPSAMVLICSMDVRSLLMIVWYLILLLGNSEIFRRSYVFPFMTLLLWQTDWFILTKPLILK
jgi:hypothetical protein